MLFRVPDDTVELSETLWAIQALASAHVPLKKPLQVRLGRKGRVLRGSYCRGGAKGTS